jgi:hypothetical protein
MDRASGFGPEGCGFDPLPVRFFFKNLSNRKILNVTGSLSVVYLQTSNPFLINPTDNYKLIMLTALAILTPFTLGMISAVPHQVITTYLIFLKTIA